MSIKYSDYVPAKSGGSDVTTMAFANGATITLDSEDFQGYLLGQISIDLHEPSGNAITGTVTIYSPRDSDDSGGVETDADCYATTQQPVSSGHSIVVHDAAMRRSRMKLVNNSAAALTLTAKVRKGK